jgi:hypothetical protein
MHTSSQLSMRSTRPAIALTAMLLCAAACTSSRQQAADPSVSNVPSASRADLFMHSVEIGDGALGWQQLCPDLQKSVSREALKAEANAQKAAESGNVRRLRSELIGARVLKHAGQVRFYLLTADLSDGSEAFRSYVLRVQMDGCVYDVQSADVH